MPVQGKDKEAMDKEINFHRLQPFQNLIRRSLRFIIKCFFKCFLTTVQWNVFFHIRMLREDWGIGIWNSSRTNESHDLFWTLHLPAAILTPPKNHTSQTVWRARGAVRSCPDISPQCVRFLCNFPPHTRKTWRFTNTVKKVSSVMVWNSVENAKLTATLLLPLTRNSC